VTKRNVAGCKGRKPLKI